MYYELYLRSFADGNGDGIGDLKGATKKLDYLAELGVDGIWLLPITSSPAYHGYTVTDYYNINPTYGDIKDLKTFLDEAHKRKIKILLDIPLNHTSPNHIWFQRALAGEKPYVDWYLWLRNEKWLNARRPWDGQPVWSKLGGKWVYTLFGPGSPDLNYENHSLWEEIKRVLAFWLAIGFDGFRFDAAKHIFDFSMEKGYCEYQHDRNISFWKEMIDYCKKINPHSIFIGEVWDSKEIVDMYSSVFGMGFNFSLSYVIKESVSELSPWRLVEGVKNTMSNYFDENRNYDFGIFLTNHDMSRLVTYMNGNKEKALLALSTLVSLPGVPFLYYGEELGMEGEYREFYNEEQLEPFQWFEAGYGPLQAEWKACGKNLPYKGISLEYQQNVDNSYYQRVKKLFEFRKQNSWIENAMILEMQNSDGLVSIELVGNGKSAMFIHNYTMGEKIVDKNKDPILLNGYLKHGEEFLLGPLSSAVIIHK
ncbi:alpha-amylase family glycosyl hydrolase [Kosmotoga sp.]|jgi:glycosidase|uniref:alpha-amylase family glycosyl hydrolase n=1 Tax=Kosmotoga sp. TaxID=1955248 RepID=UPI0024AB622C|nr:alpha-amylase family glycosyl hydrolase [Kosmotoga sp.]MDI3523933.1 alpha-amylase [Kosmotoga sp.]MDK2953287.1 alpha-amylase [Kosmotoga sp.]